MVSSTSIVRIEKANVKEVRMNGKVQPDERKVFSQTAHIPGRIEKLLNQLYWRVSVDPRSGTWLMSILPSLVTAQEELFEAYKIKGESTRVVRSGEIKTVELETNH